MGSQVLKQVWGNTMQVSTGGIKVVLMFYKICVTNKLTTQTISEQPSHNIMYGYMPIDLVEAHAMVQSKR